MRLIDGDQMAQTETEAYMAAQAQIEDLGLLRANLLAHAKVQKLIADTPAVDAVPVVRCGECIYFDPEGYGGASCAETGAMIWPNSDDYCSRGQRRDQSADARNLDGGDRDGK